VPTPDSAKAFAKLVAARTRLNEITKQLNEVNEFSSAGRQAKPQLEREWDAAFREFEKATEEFHDIVRQLHRDVETRQKTD
jgi:hypothetical protein